ncbi:MAG: hypothetical protein LQ338_004512 [Usnochroma carphineum]|nr:MAG: hypothetical protein LQ338_004512 [Usnochroma carphineum]
MRSTLPRTPLFSASFKPNAYYPSYPMQCILADPTHVLRPMISFRVQSRPKKGLWLRVSANGIGGKATVRRWAKRKVHQAVREEFRARGLGTDGMGLKGEEKEVRGTMEVTVRQPTVGAEWGAVKKEVGRLVGAVVDMAEEKGEDKIRKKHADG